ncbi:complement decay-accelerating factor, GPI-anchored-like [Halichondria panicea]|uniref:complement decay-accelerating factor, GPI-anchored-like n=1 Tax=Halichondria panicea TaxID=6063 RepID=UPI00312B578C
MEHFNCSCLNGFFASLSGTDEVVCNVTCVLPSSPLNGVLLTNTDQTESSVITFQCDPGFSLVGTETATCNNSGLWDPDPALLESNGLPTAPVDPVYEEVGLAMTPRAQDPTNKAYGQTAKQNMTLLSIPNQVYGEIKYMT